MYTKEDYFDTDCYGMTQADYTAAQYRENALCSFDKMLSLIGCDRVSGGSYEPGCCYDRIVAKPHVCAEYPYPAEFVDQHSFTPVRVRDDMFKYGPDAFDMDMMDSWNGHYDVLMQLFDLLVKYDSRCDWSRAWYYYYENLPAKEQRNIDRYCAIRDRYNVEIQRALDELCHIVEEEIDEDFKFSETDECAQMWVYDMNDRLEWQRRAKIESDFENMAGQTAAFDGYAA